MGLNPKLVRALVCLGLVASMGSVQAAKPSEVEAQIGKVIGRVTEVWEHDARYETFHKELAGKYSDTPVLTEFMANENWVVVRSSRSVLYPGILKGRSKSAVGAQFGDIVEMRISKPKSVSSYFELSEVTRVVCKAGSPEFSACEKANPVAWFDKDGATLEQPK